MEASEFTTAGGAGWTLAIRRTAWAALASLLLCSPSHGEPTAGKSAKPDSVWNPEYAVPYWSRIWSAPHDEPMYMLLHPNADTREWEAMHAGYAALSNGRGNTPTDRHYEGDYEFTWDVFTWNIPLWRVLLKPYAGKPELRYLEIGTAEGRSLLWVLENILTHPSSSATGIDPFMVEGHEERLNANIAKFAEPERVKMIKGFSQDVLPTLEPNSYDLIYIDGSHLAGDVLLDSVFTWRLLKDGGMVIHDDYMWKYQKRDPVDVRPMVAVDAFVTGMRNTARVVHRGHQLFLRKLPLELPDFCWHRDPCLRLGSYLYAWKSDRLLEIGTSEPVLLSPKERRVLKKIIRARRIGADAELLLEEDIASIRSKNPKEFARLVTLLDLRISPARRGASAR